MSSKPNKKRTIKAIGENIGTKSSSQMVAVVNNDELVDRPELLSKVYDQADTERDGQDVISQPTTAAMFVNCDHKGLRSQFIAGIEVSSLRGTITIVPLSKKDRCDIIVLKMFVGHPPMLINGIYHRDQICMLFSLIDNWRAEITGFSLIDN